jgi:hypothetical protein
MSGVRLCHAQRWLRPYLREDFFKELKVIILLLSLVLVLVMTLFIGLTDPYVASETHLKASTRCEQIFNAN